MSLEAFWNRAPNCALRSCKAATAAANGDFHDTADRPPPGDHGVAANAKDRLSEMADTATDKVKDVAESAQDMAGKVADQARVYGEQAQDAVKQVKPLVEKSLKEQPMATLAGVAVLGFVLGALWKK